VDVDANRSVSPPKTADLRGVVRGVRIAYTEGVKNRLAVALLAACVLGSAVAEGAGWPPIPFRRGQARVAAPMANPHAPVARGNQKRYDHDDISQTYFFPRKTGELPHTKTAAPVPLALSDGTPIGGYWSRPLKGAPTILYLYGNGETVADQLHRWPAWAEKAKANVFFVDYPGYGTSHGKPSLSGATGAAEAALDYLLSRPAEEVPSVVLVGRSAGSIFALHAAQRKDPRVRGLILESGVADIKQRFDQRLAHHPDKQALLEDIERDYNHEAKVKNLGIPLMVLHTEKDSVVPSWHGGKLATWAKTQPVLFPHGDHNDIQVVNGDAYQKHLGDFVARVTR
jgi:pimeloyl-ACP methyl ester carboxylesterase